MCALLVCETVYVAKWNYILLPWLSSVLKDTLALWLLDYECFKDRHPEGSDHLGVLQLPEITHRISQNKVE